MKEAGKYMRHGTQNTQLSAINNDADEPLRVDVSPPPMALSARAAQRLSVLGEMTGGIVHDFRNILSVIDSGLRLAESNLGDPDKTRCFISGAREGIARGVRLTLPHNFWTSHNKARSSHAPQTRTHSSRILSCF